MTDFTSPATQATVRTIASNCDVGGLLVRRWFGCWLDLIFLAAVLFVPLLIAGSFNAPESVTGTVLTVAILAVLAYFPVMESVWGRSLGKFATGLVVVDESGATPHIWRVLVRTLLRLVEVDPFLAGGIPAGLCVMLSPHRQRLGDMAAGTFVLPADKVREVRSLAGAELVF